jgi:CRISPR-associated protein Cas1
MSKRIIEIATEGCYLKVRHNQLIIERAGEEVGSIPIEDMSALIVDHPQTLITQAVLRELLKANVMIISSDERHQPVGLLLPLDSHTTQTERFAAQVELGLATKKNLWKQVVQGKVRGQAKVLHDVTGNDAGISQLVKKVRSGDPSNIEAQAARRYWSRLFASEQFKRDRFAEDQNRYLNYGYAVLRALVSRSLCAAGLHPSIGIHHKNRYNSYCLADDLMEPYRPLVDINVWQIVDDFGHKKDMDREIRLRLIEIIKREVTVDGEKLTFQGAVQKSAQSLARVMLGQEKLLSLPEY